MFLTVLDNDLYKDNLNWINCYEWVSFKLERLLKKL